MFEKIRDSEKIIYIGSIAIGAIFYSQLLYLIVPQIHLGS